MGTFTILDCNVVSGLKQYLNFAIMEPFIFIAKVL